MKFIETPIKDLWIIEPTVFEDSRGYFFESFNKRTFKKGTGLNIDFVQDNQSKSEYGVLRGMHWQEGEHAQAKLVSVLEGAVQDIAVDLRPNSPTYGQYYSIILSAENKTQFFVPRGFAHGFLVLSETAVFSYKCDNYYNKESEGGIIYNCPKLNIAWALDEKDFKLSDKDKMLPCLKA
ncbi:MAG: dTDP-4-dehydrorhamnose 3,5-epimerase [Chitinophagales bacterium]|nr:dTDP-4-dehydrorhamnose 3,5-epimerase [Chitinophagales bacterium]